MTKRHEAIITRYNNSTAHTMRDVYGKWSNAKEKAYNDCLKKCADDDGRGFKIIGANTSFFSVGYIKDDGATLVYITHGGREEIALN